MPAEAMTRPGPEASPSAPPPSAAGGGRAVEWACALLAAALPITIAGANLGWALLLAVLIVQRLGGGRLDPRSLRSPLLWPLLAALAVGLASAHLGEGLRWPAHKGDVHRLWLATLFAAGFASLSCAARLSALAAFALGGAAVALVGIGQACLGLARTGAWTRAHAFVHPVTYGELMGFAALASLAWLCARDMRAQPAAKRRAAQLALAATLIALVLSGTRGAILGVFAGAFALSALPGRRWLALAAVPLAAASLLAADLLPQGATRSLLLELKGRQSGQSFRLVLWTAAADMFREKPWLGTGPGAFRSQLPRYSAAGLDGERSFGTAHNLYLHHLAERGALGLASTLWLLGAMAWGAWRRARDDADAPGLWAWCAAAAFPFMNLTEVALQTEQVWMSLFFIWFLALARPGATGEARGGA